MGWRPYPSLVKRLKTSTTLIRAIFADSAAPARGRPGMCKIKYPVVQGAATGKSCSSRSPAASPCSTAAFLSKSNRNCTYSSKRRKPATSSAKRNRFRPSKFASCV
jgi:hypothetical protein